MANLLKTITSTATVRMCYWMLVSQDITLLHGIWIALSNHRTVEPQLTSAFTGLSKQQEQDKFQGEYLSLLWRNTHCRERRKIEEYSSLKVTDSDNNSIKNLLNFLSLLSEQIFRIRVTSSSLSPRISLLSHRNADCHFRMQKKAVHFRMQKRDLCVSVC